jgi:general secretion pathway protein I
MKHRLKSGFTLIEIMVALAIITITLGAIIENTTAANINAQYLRDKTVAGWIAMNQISLVRAKRQWGSASASKQGEVEMAGQQWQWRINFVKTDDANIRRLNVQVFKLDAEKPIVLMSGFMGNL